MIVVCVVCVQDRRVESMHARIEAISMGYLLIKEKQ